MSQEAGRKLSACLTMGDNDNRVLSDTCGLKVTVTSELIDCYEDRDRAP